MKIKPEDRAKFIGLMAGIGVVAVYFALTVIPRLSHAAPAPRPAGGAAAAMAARPAAMPDPDALGEPIGPAPRDPFKPPVPPAAPMQVIGPTRLPGGGPMRLALAHLSAVAVKPPLPNAVEVEGVITGERAVAVLQVDGQTVQKLQGQSVAPGVQLARVREDGVELRVYSESVFVPIGHTADFAYQKRAMAAYRPTRNPFVPMSGGAAAGTFPVRDGAAQASAPDALPPMRAIAPPETALSQ